MSVKPYTAKPRTTTLHVTVEPGHALPQPRQELVTAGTSGVRYALHVSSIANLRWLDDGALEVTVRGTKRAIAHAVPDPEPGEDEPMPTNPTNPDEPERPDFAWFDEARQLLDHEVAHYPSTPERVAAFRARVVRAAEDISAARGATGVTTAHVKVAYLRVRAPGVATMPWTEGAQKTFNRLLDGAGLDTIRAATAAAEDRADGRGSAAVSVGDAITGVNFARDARYAAEHYAYLRTPQGEDRS